MRRSGARSTSPSSCRQASRRTGVARCSSSSTAAARTTAAIAVAATTDGAVALSAQPLWVDAGDEDPFLPGDRALVTGLQAAGDTSARLDTKPGGHDDGYWSGRWKAYLSFYAAALARCR